MSDTIITTETTQLLRAELKQWEKTFAQAHNGRKPTREDIKNDGTTAEKYRRFNRLCRPQTADRSQHTTPEKRTSRRPRTRDGPLAEHSTNVPTAAIRLPTLESQQEDEHEVEEQEVEATPAHIRRALGPTPQKDGFVLGIFDLFASNTSPSKTDLTQTVAGTPTKSLRAMMTAQCSRTPQSSSKRFYLDAFAGTPLKRKREDDGGTPASVKRLFATPSFLRRDNKFDAILEESSSLIEESSTAPKKPGNRKGLARSFSSIIANLRKQEEEQMDDEWDIMRELEAEEDAETSETNGVPVEDSQAIDMPLGPDQPSAAADDDKEAAANPGTTRKPWKKKGLKRQTKRVKMKPVLHAPQKATVDEAGNALDEGTTTSHRQQESDGSNDESASKTAPTKEDGMVRKTVRKVNEAAHMNFRRLKIKSKNAKPKGRFGRR